ncbi:VanZ family protein [Methanolobus sp. ZRKC2]|uniref:VanZ family protein n=1 Tax=Methanolobus sp. ZRKC2 TaxID=3125783 RepID=UPI0032519701
MRGLLDIVQKILSFNYKSNKKHIFLLLTVFYAAMIFYLSSRSDIGVPTHMFKVPVMYQLKDFLESQNLGFLIDFVEYSYLHRDKIAHIFLYFGLGVFLHLTFRNSDNRILKKYAALLAVVTGILYGISDEIHQMYVPGRTSSIHDIYADGIGVTIAQIAFFALLLIGLHGRKKKEKVRQDET